MTKIHIPGVSVKQAAASWQLAAGHYEAAQIPIEIIAPQAGLTTGTAAPSYYYRCYPGIQWQVPITVLGGAWPFKYELTDSSYNPGVEGTDYPTGMSIGETYNDANYGVLTWPSPVDTASETLYIKVTDQEGSTATVTWTLTVTTSNTLFCDATATDDTGAGTVGDPFKTMDGWLEPGAGSRTTATYQHNHVYYRAGTYYTSWDYDSEWSNTGKMPMRTKPKVHIQYPGESAIINIAGNGGSHPGGEFWFVDHATNANDDIFFSNINFQGLYSQDTFQAYQQAMGWSELKRANVFKCLFDDFQGPAVAGNNAAMVFTGRGTTGTYSKNLISISHNTIDGMRGGQVGEFYNSEKIVFEANTMANTGVDGEGGRLFYAKETTKNCSVRNNTGIDNCDETLAQIGSSVAVYDEIEVCWNNWEVEVSTKPILQIGIEQTVSTGQHYIFRNTLTGGRIVHEDTAGGGPVWYQNNVRQYDTGTNGILDVNAQFTWNGDDTDLVGTSGLVDATTNLLTGANRTSYLGLKGHEVD